MPQPIAFLATMFLKILNDYSICGNSSDRAKLNNRSLYQIGKDGL
jgi:hypothetical protein